LREWDFYDYVAVFGFALFLTGGILDLLGLALSPIGYINWWPAGCEGLELTVLGFVLWPVGLAIFGWGRRRGSGA
jgi:hypothetical protein